MEKQLSSGLSNTREMSALAQRAAGAAKMLSQLFYSLSSQGLPRLPLDRSSAASL